MEITVSQTPKDLSAANDAARRWGLICYALYGLGVAVFVFLFIGLAFNYGLKSRLQGSLAESHIIWQIRTFWYTVGFMLVGIATAYINLGYLIIFAGALLLCVRLVWGAIRLYLCRPM